MNDQRTHLAQLDEDAKVTESERLEQIETELRDELHSKIKSFIIAHEIKELDCYLADKGLCFAEILSQQLVSFTDKSGDYRFSMDFYVVLIWGSTWINDIVNDVASYFVGKMDFEQLLDTEIERRKINDSYDVGV